MNIRAVSSVIVLAALSVLGAGSVQAQTYTTSTSVGYDPNAPTSNFGSPSNVNNETAYTVRTGIDNSFFYVDVTAMPPAGTTPDQFANIYLGGPNNPQGFVIEVTNDRAIKTNGNPLTDYKSLAGTGFTFNAALNDISFALPISYLETDPQGIGFVYNPGDLVRVSGSQSFGYSYDGGSTYYNSVTRLGAQTLPAAGAVPEPATWAMMILGLGVIGFAMRRRVIASEAKFNAEMKRAYADIAI